MGNNPSFFSEDRFCKTTIVNGVRICPDFPADSVRFRDEHHKDSVQEFLRVLHRIFKKANLDAQFRVMTRSEFVWAARGGTETTYVSGASPADLWKYTTYSEIAALDPEKDPQLRVPSYSRCLQTCSVRLKAANSYGFRRSGLWEWTFDPDVVSFVDVGRSRYGYLNGGSWYVPAGSSASKSEILRL
jgi:hypothetical protein